MTRLALFRCMASSGVAAGVLACGAASAADLGAPEPFVANTVLSRIDVAFGVAGVTDYRFRGISHSNKKPAIQGYAEVQVANWVYAGVWASSVKLPARFGLSDPALEIDLYGGIRRSWDNFTLDVGGLYYLYPGESTPGPIRQLDYWEIYAKPTFTIGDYGAIGVNAFWSSDFINTGSDALFVSIIPKVNLPISSIPDVSFYVSGEFGRQWLGKTTIFRNRIDWKDYYAWNLGGGVAYKAMTLDVRYSDTSLSPGECRFNTGNGRWCGATVVGKISFDTTLSSLK